MAAQLIPFPGCETVLSFSCAGLRIGGVSVRLSGELSRGLSFDTALRPFAWTDRKPDIQLSIGWSDHLPSVGTEPVFDSNAVWKLFRRDEQSLFDFFSPKVGSGPYKRLLPNPDFRSARLLLNSSVLEKELPVTPLEYPTDELLFTNYLAAHGLGVEVHGCGLVDPAGGSYLFLGHSGAGKSTTAHLWDSLRGAEILSDDRLIL